MVLVFLGLLAEDLPDSVFFSEYFDNECFAQFVQSTKHPPGKPFGRFQCSHGNYPVDQKLQTAITTLDNHRHYAAAARFRKCWTSEHSRHELILQYVHKQDRPLICGGAYVKLLPDGLDPLQFTGSSPYSIMFGPDICHAHTHTTKFLISRNGTNFMSTARVDPPDDGLSHLLTLRLFGNGTYAVYKDMDEKHSGAFRDDFDYEGPRFIIDPYDKRPGDWDDREYIPDPEHEKPADWDDRETVPIVNYSKPATWRDAVDGVWSPPHQPNPNYQGRWKPRLIVNPNYQGQWRPRKIPNPDYSPDALFGIFDNICYIGIDILQDNAGTMYDDLLVTDNWTYAMEVAEERWRPLVEPQKAAFAHWGGKERWERQREWGILDDGISANFGKDAQGNVFAGSDAFYKETVQKKKPYRHSRMQPIADTQNQAGVDERIRPDL